MRPPEEVLECFRLWKEFGGGPKKIYFRSKQEIHRAGAWEVIKRTHSHDNLWHKNHTDNYWIWYRK